jgi:hypothetical protein
MEEDSADQLVDPSESLRRVRFRSVHLRDTDRPPSRGEGHGRDVNGHRIRSFVRPATRCRRFPPANGRVFAAPRRASSRRMPGSASKRSPVLGRVAGLCAEMSTPPSRSTVCRSIHASARGGPTGRQLEVRTRGDLHRDRRVPGGTALAGGWPPAAQRRGAASAWPEPGCEHDYPEARILHPLDEPDLGGASNRPRCRSNPGDRQRVTRMVLPHRDREPRMNVPASSVVWKT